LGQVDRVEKEEERGRKVEWKVKYREEQERARESKREQERARESKRVQERARESERKRERQKSAHH
jgi:hypothetical protein